MFLYYYAENCSLAGRESVYKPKIGEEDGYLKEESMYLGWGGCVANCVGQKFSEFYFSLLSFSAAPQPSA